MAVGKLQHSFRKYAQIASMARRVWPFALGGIALFCLAGCGWIEREQRPAWRTQAENVCLSQGLVKPSPYIEPRSEISGPGICGMIHPFKVTALADGAVRLDKSLTMDCSMIPAIETWLEQVVQPLAQARFGQRVTQLDVFGAYSCRSVDNISGARLSEHAFGNAIDVSGFKLADGREILIARDWRRSGTQESAFLHEAHAGACDNFTTVLGPGSDVFHYNHFHLDLAAHGSTNTGPRRYCKPAPSPNLTPLPSQPDGLPPAPEIEEPMDVSRTRRVGLSPRFAMAPMSLHGGLDAALPPPVQTYYDHPLPPVLPVEPSGELDTAPTSSTLESRDD
jgi:hypothetical protein